MDDDTTPPAHGRIITGEGKGKADGPGSILHGKHATEIIVITSVIGVGLAFATFRKGGSAGSAPATTSPAGVTAGDVAGFDQASVQGLTDNLQTFQEANASALQQLTDALAANGKADAAAQAQQSTVLQNITSALGGLPQQIISKLPTPAAAPSPAPAPPAPTHNPAPAPQAAPGQYHTVVAGETLSGIAARYPSASITAASIGRLNGIRNLNLIHPGQRLRIF